MLRAAAEYLQIGMLLVCAVDGKVNIIANRQPEEREENQQNAWVVHDVVRAVMRGRVRE